MTNLKQQLSDFNDGKFDECYNFYDWFCKDSELKDRAIKLYKKVNEIANSDKFDLEKTYVFFKNNCGFKAPYDDFRICDTATGNVIYTVTPSYDDDKLYCHASVYGKKNDFQEPLVEGSWQDVVNFFK